MRTPTWESSPGALAALFETAAPLIKVDAWTFTLPSGEAHRWSGADVPLSFGGNSFILGPGIARGRASWQVGIATDTLEVTLTDVAGTTFSGHLLQAFVRASGFEGAQVQLERVFFAAGASTPTGALLWFLGEVENVVGDRHAVNITAASFTRRLEVAVPRDVYQTQCRNQLFDARCGVSQAGAAATGTAASGSDTYRTSFNHALSQPAGWGTLGIITFSNGANAGISRTCKLHTAGALSALQPWPFPVVAGDAFSLQAGCDRLKATCEAKFNNLAAFRAEPFVPAPETVL